MEYTAAVQATVSLHQCDMSCPCFLLRHNFVHTDLHPGNIMIRMMDSRGSIVGK
jgi:hypothetical protein